MYKFKFADIGEGLTEGTITEVFVKENDEVKEGDNLFSVETDKVTTDIPSPVTGRIVKVLVKVDQIIHVGDEVVHFDTKDIPNESEKNASVVGEVEVSDKELSFDKYKK